MLFSHSPFFGKETARTLLPITDAKGCEQATASTRGKKQLLHRGARLQTPSEARPPWFRIRASKHSPSWDDHATERLSLDVLLLGTDEMLLRTREKLLDLAGIQVTALDNLEAWQKLPFMHYRLLHICQSVDLTTATDIARSARRMSSDTVLVFTDASGNADVRAFDELLPPLLDPARYVRTIANLLATVGPIGA